MVRAGAARLIAGRRGSEMETEVYDMDFVLVVMVGTAVIGWMSMRAILRTRELRHRDHGRDVLQAASEIVEAHERQLS